MAGFSVKLRGWPSAQNLGDFDPSFYAPRGAFLTVAATDVDGSHAYQLFIDNILEPTPLISVPIRLAEANANGEPTATVTFPDVQIPPSLPLGTSYVFRIFTFFEEPAGEFTGGPSQVFEVVASDPSTNESLAASLAGYFSGVDEADTLARTVAGLATYKATSGEDARRAALEAAADRIDTAMRYQGRKYDPAQVREFPRVAYGSALPYQIVPQPFPYSGTTVWDWNDATNVAVVPPKVKKANLIEADALLSSTSDDRDERRQAIADGVASQAIGSLNESYFQQRIGGNGMPQLCIAANQIMRFYMLRSGQSL